MDSRTRLVVLAVGVAVVALHVAVVWWLSRDVPAGPDEGIYLRVANRLVAGTDWSIHVERFQGPLALRVGTWFVAPLSSVSGLAVDPEIVAMRTGRLPFVVLLLVVVWGWSWQAFGWRGGLLSLTVAAMSPTLLAWGGILTVDVPLAAMTAAALWLMWRFVRAPSFAAAGAFGIALGAAFATKYSAIVVALAVPFLALLAWRPLRGFGGGRWTVPVPMRVGLLLAMMLVALAAALLALHASYGFAAPWFDPTSSGPVKSGLISALARTLGSATFLSLLPEPFVLGIDYQSSQSSGLHGYFADYDDQHRHPAYYLATLLTKTPVATMLLLVWGKVAFAASSRRCWTTAWVVGLPAGIYLAYMSFLNSLMGGIRYLMPVVVLMHVWVGAVYLSTARSRVWRRVRASAVALLCAWTLVSIAVSWPIPSAYFNEAIGGPVGATRLFNGQNCDWLQYHDRGRDAMRARYPDLHVLEHGEGPRFGVVACYVQAIKSPDPYRPGRTTHWLRRFQPIDHYGASWFVYRIDPGAWQECVESGDRDAAFDGAFAWLGAGDLDKAHRMLQSAPEGPRRTAAIRAVRLCSEAEEDPRKARPAVFALNAIHRKHRGATMARRHAHSFAATELVLLLVAAGAPHQGLEVAQQTIDARPLEPEETLAFAVLFRQDQQFERARRLLTEQRRPAPGDPLESPWNDLLAEVAGVLEGAETLGVPRTLPRRQQ